MLVLEGRRGWSVLVRVAVAAGLMAVCGVAGAQAGLVEVGVAGGAPYRMDVPAKWNHSLVVYYHGYAETPTQFAKEQGVGAMQVLLDRGYAVVQSGFSVTGWALPQAYAETEALRVAFGKAHGAPQETYLTGFSMGGALTMMTMERNPEPYAGALDLCGAVVPANEWAGRRFALRAAFDFYFPGVLPALVPAAANYVETKATGDAVLAALRAKPEDAEKMRRLTGEYRDEDVAHLMQYVEYQASDFARKAGGSVVDTMNWVYTGTGSAEEDYRLNDGVKRYAADPAARRWLVEHYSGTGRLKKPMLAVHTVNDPLIPAGTLEIYAERVAEAGDTDRFVQQYVDHTGHCAISQDEVGRAFDELVGWVHGGKKPVGGKLP